MTALPESRYAFPQPNESAVALRWRILDLMRDGKRRSVIEIQDALGTRKEVSARVRELRAQGFNFSDARSEGPDPDGAYRWQLYDHDLIRNNKTTEGA